MVVCCRNEHNSTRVEFSEKPVAFSVELALDWCVVVSNRNGSLLSIICAHASISHERRAVTRCVSPQNAQIKRCDCSPQRWVPCWMASTQTRADTFYTSWPPTPSCGKHTPSYACVQTIIVCVDLCFSIILVLCLVVAGELKSVCFAGDDTSRAARVGSSPSAAHRNHSQIR